jgi:hypothetical protein
MPTEPTNAHDEATGFHLEPQVAKRFLVFSTGLWLGDRPFRSGVLLAGFSLAVAVSILATDVIKDGCKALFDNLTVGNIGVLWQAGLFLGLLVVAGVGVTRVILRTHSEQARAWALTLGLGASLLLSTGITVAL